MCSFHALCMEAGDCPGRGFAACRGDGHPSLPKAGFYYEVNYHVDHLLINSQLGLRWRLYNLVGWFFKTTGNKWQAGSWDLFGNKEGHEEMRMSRGRPGAPWSPWTWSGAPSLFSPLPGAPVRFPPLSLSGVLLSMGFGFVEYRKPDQAQKALKQLQVSGDSQPRSTGAWGRRCGIPSIFWNWVGMQISPHLPRPIAFSSSLGDCGPRPWTLLSSPQSLQCIPSVCNPWSRAWFVPDLREMGEADLWRNTPRPGHEKCLDADKADTVVRGSLL